MSQLAFVNGADANLIDGELIPGGAPFEVIDPSTAQGFALCPGATNEGLDQAVAAARRAFPGWAAQSFEARRSQLEQFANSIERNAQSIAPLLSREHGKPIEQAAFELRVAAHHIKQLSAIVVADEVLRDDDRGRVEFRYLPLGVVGGIAPWNFPIALAMHKAAQALYTGNTLVLKPSPYTPLATLAVARLARDTLPPGVLNVLAGGNDLGALMTAHPDIDKITFTGSVETGKRVLASAAGTLKRVTLELGGNDPAIVLDDADLDLVAASLARSAFFNCGQICMAVKRVYIDLSVWPAFIDKFVQKVKALKVGPGDEPGVDMGPLQNLAQYKKVCGYLEDALAQPGAKVWTGGMPKGNRGYFIEPTIISNLSDHVALVREEQFGPVLPILTFTDIQDAVRRANDTRFGLAASVWSTNETRAHKVAEKIMAGTVWINRHGLNESDVPFGGMKESGIGREHGLVGLRSYMELQIISQPRA